MFVWMAVWVQCWYWMKLLLDPGCKATIWKVGLYVLQITKKFNLPWKDDFRDFFHRHLYRTLFMLIQRFQGNFKSIEPSYFIEAMDLYRQEFRFERNHFSPNDLFLKQLNRWPCHLQCPWENEGDNFWPFEKTCYFSQSDSITRHAVIDVTVKMLTIQNLKLLQ